VLDIDKAEPLPYVRLLAVVVLYRTTPQASASLRTLLAAFAAAPAGTLKFQILVYDNAPSGVDPGLLPDGVRYQAVSHNAGIASAYNQALKIAEEEHYDWLLTLDQDTLLPPDFLVRVSEAICKVESTPIVATIVPHITGDGKTLSPYWFRGGAIVRWFDKGFTGAPSRDVFAFNSAATIRVTALHQIAGYDPRFWLDNSDAYLFRQLHRHGKQVFVAGNIEVAHDFSMMDMRNRITPARYRNILLAESAFWDLEMGALAALERTARLIVRVYRHLRRKDNPELRAITYEFLRRRIFWTRRSRLQAWETETRALFPGLPDTRPDAFCATVASEHPFKVSVCMATYNGEQYIGEQIRSVLGQLGEHDEVIVVDDASLDQTRERVIEFNDTRIKLIKHVKNFGVVETFEEAVRNATGDILFLSDGDDIWAPDKVAKVLTAFSQNPRTQVVTTGIQLVDESGRQIDGREFMKNRKFTSALLPNLVRNRYQGSTMAFRSSLLAKILPFPKGKAFLHDAWIGACNGVTGGETVYIDEALLYYRRHSSNFSNPLTLHGKVSARVQLVLALAARWLGLALRGTPKMTPH
jgi:glycosyltransferase involved in cell wall biosynthesis